MEEPNPKKAPEPLRPEPLSGTEGKSSLISKIGSIFSKKSKKPVETASEGNEPKRKGESSFLKNFKVKDVASGDDATSQTAVDIPEEPDWGKHLEEEKEHKPQRPPQQRPKQMPKLESPKKTMVLSPGQGLPAKGSENRTMKIDAIKTVVLPPDAKPSAEKPTPPIPPTPPKPSEILAKQSGSKRPEPLAPKLPPVPKQISDAKQAQTNPTAAKSTSPGQSEADKKNVESDTKPVLTKKIPAEEIQTQIVSRPKLPPVPKPKAPKPAPLAEAKPPVPSVTKPKALESQVQAESKITETPKPESKPLPKPAEKAFPKLPKIEQKKAPELKIKPPSPKPAFKPVAYKAPSLEKPLSLTPKPGPKITVPDFKPIASSEKRDIPLPPNIVPKPPKPKPAEPAKEVKAAVSVPKTTAPKRVPVPPPKKKAQPPVTPIGDKKSVLGDTSVEQKTTDTQMSLDLPGKEETKPVVVLPGQKNPQMPVIQSLKTKTGVDEQIKALPLTQLPSLPISAAVSDSKTASAKPIRVKVEMPKSKPTAKPPKAVKIEKPKEKSDIKKGLKKETLRLKKAEAKIKPPIPPVPISREAKTTSDPGKTLAKAKPGASSKPAVVASSPEKVGKAKFPAVGRGPSLIKPSELKAPQESKKEPKAKVASKPEPKTPVAPVAKEAVKLPESVSVKSKDQAITETRPKEQAVQAPAKDAKDAPVKSVETGKASKISGKVRSHKKSPKVILPPAKEEKSDRRSVIWIPLVMLLLAGIGFALYWYQRETSVEVAVASGDLQVQSEALIVLNFAGKLELLRNDYFRRRTPLEEDMKDSKANLAAAKGDLAGRVQRKKLLEDALEQYRSEIPEYLSDSQDALSNLWDVQSANLESEYDNFKESLHQQIEQRARELNVTYERNKKIDAIAVAVNAFRLGLYDVANEVNVASERAWAEDILQEWVKYEEGWREEQLSIKKKAMEIKKEPLPKIAETRKRIENLEREVEALEIDIGSLNEECERHEGYVKETMNRLASIDQPFLDELKRVPDEFKVASFPVSSDGRVVLGQLHKNEELNQGVHMMLVRATRGDEVFWAIQEFEVLPYQQVMVEIGKEQFISLKSVLDKGLFQQLE